MIIELKGNKLYLQASKYMPVTGHCIVVVSILTWTRMTGSFLLELKRVLFWVGFLFMQDLFSLTENQSFDQS